MKYSIKSYIRAGLYVPLSASILVLLLFTVCIIMFIRKKDYSFIQIVKTVILPSIGLLFFMGCYVLPTLKHTVFLFVEKSEDVIQSNGEIESISEVIASPRYYISDDSTEIVRASIIRIEGVDYYFMTKGTLKKGEAIAIKYLPRSRIVLSWEYTSNS